MARPPISERTAVPTVGSALIHVVALTLAWWTAGMRQPPPRFETYEIEMVAMPAAEAEEPAPAPAEEELVVERPEEAPPRPEPETPPPPEETRPEEREPEREEPEPEPPAEDPAPETPPRSPEEPETPPAPAEAAPEDPGSDAVNVRLEGLRRDYPAYYNNIILQIRRCFRYAGGGSPEATVYFVIRRDGTVSDLRFVQRSGNASFDFEALGAVECAGSRGRFGPLPPDLPYDRLPVRFNFRPAGVSGTFPAS